VSNDPASESARTDPNDPGAGRRLLLCMDVSLDGFVARSDRTIDFLDGEDTSGPDHGDQRHRITLELLGQIGLIVLGRGAYEDMVKGWPGSDNPMARLMNTRLKVVFSDSLPDVAWSNARLNRRPLEEEIPKLTHEPGGDIVVFGGARIAHSLIRARLVDEYRLTVHPVALGTGLSLMHGLPEPQRLQLISSAAYADGCVVQILRPTRLPTDDSP
jgi:dihydrofolate reductase